MSHYLAELITPIILLLGGLWLFLHWKQTQKKLHFWLAIISIILSVFNFFHLLHKYEQDQEKERINLEKMEKDKENFQTSIKERIADALPLKKDSIVLFDNTLEILVPKEFTVIEAEDIRKVKYLTLTRISDKGNYQITISKTFYKKFVLSDVIKEYEETVRLSEPSVEFKPNKTLNKFEGECIINDYSISHLNKLVIDGSISYVKRGNVLYRICFINLQPENVKANLITEQIYKSIKIN